jgi:N-acetylglucosaminyldiphosphoundecaprenol N-acetyl-beta-D-mannosaminyltransferase
MRAKLLGFDIDTFDFEGAVEFAKNACGQVVTINPEMMSNPDMKEIVNSSQLVIPDGIGVEIGLKICGYNVKRIPGIQFAHRMIEECAKDAQKVALIGAKPEIIEKAANNLKQEFKNLDIAYVQDGYFKDDEQVLLQLQQSRARLVLCALGSPKQELFIQKAKQILPHALFIGVGGSFDVWSGEVQRAPEIYQKLGLEWFYRTVKEPQRFKRIFPTLPLFVLKVLREKFIPKGV